jgi:hypothetical protein
VAELERWLLGPNGELSKVLHGLSALEVAESDVLMDYHEQSEHVERQWERWLAAAHDRVEELTEFKESLEDENEALGKTVGELRAALAKVHRPPKPATCRLSRVCNPNPNLSPSPATAAAVANHLERWGSLVHGGPSCPARIDHCRHWSPCDEKHGRGPAAFGEWGNHPASSVLRGSSTRGRHGHGESFNKGKPALETEDIHAGHDQLTHPRTIPTLLSSGDGGHAARQVHSGDGAGGGRRDGRAAVVRQRRRRASGGEGHRGAARAGACAGGGEAHPDARGRQGATSSLLESSFV